MVRLKEIDPKYECYGIDINQTAIKAAKKLDPLGRYEVASAKKIPFNDEMFPQALMQGSLGAMVGGNGLEFGQRVLDEISRVLKKEGILVFMDFGRNLSLVPHYMFNFLRGNPFGTRKVFSKEGQFLFQGQHFSKQQIINMMKQAGLTPFEIQTVRTVSKVSGSKRNSHILISRKTS